jgi:RHS repeat-associated protein
MFFSINKSWQGLSRRNLYAAILVHSGRAKYARQQITAATYGTSLLGVFGFDDYGYPTHTKAHVSGTYRQDYRYSFNPVTGNLNSRQNYLLSKSFTYDNLDRLKTVTGPQNLTMDYAANGNILTKSDVGTNTFEYNHPTKPYALTDLETASGLVPEDLQVATYTSFEQVSTIDEGDYHATFTYNADDQRAKMLVTDLGSPVLTRWYVGSRYIKETEDAVTKEFTWVGGDAYSAPAVAVKQGANTTWYYLLRDHLGNITHVVNTSNNVVAEYSYDAWGRRRDPDDWGSYDVSGEPALFAGRGFTGHEWLPWFNLYNMNGRLYDPVVGRFLSADNYVQAPGFSQSFNRYSYALNNPLKYTDPDGEWLQYVIAGLIILGKNYFDGKKANNQEPNPFKWDWSRAFFMIGNTSSLDGSSSTWHLGIGWSPEALPAIGLNNNDGFGAGYWSPDGVNLGYPGKQTTSPEEKVNQEINDVRQAHGQAWMESSYSGAYNFTYRNSDFRYFDPYNRTFLLELGMGMGDFYKNYKDMRQANWLYSDKYFHAKANFQASHRGPGGEFFAEHFSNLREIWDQRIKGYPRSDSQLDQDANRYGREQSKYFGPNEFREALKLYRPKNLPEKY